MIQVWEWYILLIVDGLYSFIGQTFKRKSGIRDLWSQEFWPKNTISSTNVDFLAKSKMSGSQVEFED